MKTGCALNSASRSFPVAWACAASQRPGPTCGRRSVPSRTSIGFALSRNGSRSKTPGPVLVNDDAVIAPDTFATPPLVAVTAPNVHVLPPPSNVPPVSASAQPSGSARSFPATSVPPATSTGPAKVFAAFRTSRPAPFFTRPPEAFAASGRSASTISFVQPPRASVALAHV